MGAPTLASVEGSVTDLVHVKRALLSVSDKTGLVELAKFLHEKGVELLSTGGTAKTIREAGAPVPAEREGGREGGRGHGAWPPLHLRPHRASRHAGQGCV